MTDDLEQRLRSALPPTNDEVARRDLWPAVVERLSVRPRWSLLDLGLGTAAVLALRLFPESLAPLLYHL
jgi:hypothetical protein